MVFAHNCYSLVPRPPQLLIVFFILSAVEYMNSCPDLPVPANANATHYDEGNELEVAYKCNAGYTMMGFERISCVRYGHMAQWNGLPPVCFRKFIHFNIVCLMLTMHLSCDWTQYHTLHTVNNV